MVGTPIFTYEHRVTYAECTMGNHVYYGRYLELLETARGEFFRKLGKTFLQWQQEDTIFPVLECTLRYRAPARYDDILQIEVLITELDKIRITFGYRIILKDTAKLILEAETQHVCTSLNEKPKRIPEELSAALLPYCKPTSR